MIAFPFAAAGTAFGYETVRIHLATMTKVGKLPRGEPYGGLSDTFFDQAGGIGRLKPNGLRLMTGSIKSQVSYGVDLHQPEPGTPAQGMLYLYFGYSCWVERRFPFQIPAARFNEAMHAFDTKSDSYWGHYEFRLDGTSIEYERIRDGRLTSNGGNQDHFLELGNIVLEAIRPALPPETLPPNERWSSWENPATVRYIQREAKKSGCELSQ
jgi:hypothetical protein